MKGLKALNPGLYVLEYLTWADYPSKNQKFTEFSQAVLEVKVKTPTGKEVAVAMPFPETRKTD